MTVIVNSIINLGCNDGWKTNFVTLGGMGEEESVKTRIGKSSEEFY